MIILNLTDDAIVLKRTKTMNSFHLIYCNSQEKKEFVPHYLYKKYPHIILIKPIKLYL